MHLKIVSVLALSGLMCMGGVVIANVKKNDCKDMICYCQWFGGKCHSNCSIQFDEGQMIKSCIFVAPGCNKLCKHFCGEETNRNSCNNKSYPNELHVINDEAR